MNSMIMRITTFVIICIITTQSFACLSRCTTRLKTSYPGLYTCLNYVFCCACCCSKPAPAPVVQPLQIQVQPALPAPVIVVRAEVIDPYPEERARIKTIHDEVMQYLQARQREVNQDLRLSSRKEVIVQLPLSQHRKIETRLYVIKQEIANFGTKFQQLKAEFEGNTVLLVELERARLTLNDVKKLFPSLGLYEQHKIHGTH